MANTAKADVDALEKRVAALEDFQKEVNKTMLAVTGAKWFVGAFAVVGIAAVANAIYTFGVLGTKVENQARQIKRLEDEQDDTTRLFKKKIFATALVYEGKIIKVTAEQLVIRTVPPDDKELAFRLLPDTRITVKDKPAKAGDLRPGMSVLVIEGEKGEAVRVEVDPPPPPKGFQRFGPALDK